MEKKKLNPPKAQFHHTKYPGVLYLESAARTQDGKPERIYYIRYRDPSGRQRFEKAGKLATTPGKANAIRGDRSRGKEPTNRERRASEKAAKGAKAGRWTFSRLLEAYLESRGEYPRRVTDAGNFRKHLLKAIGDKTPAELSPFEVDRIRLTMLKKYQPGTVVAVLGILVRLSSFGVKRRLCEGIKFPVELPKGGTVKTESMTDQQMSAYLKAAATCENNVIGAFLTFELLTGMRFGEAQNLMWSAVDLHHNAIHIRNPKGGRDQFIPLNAAAADLLRQLPHDAENPYVFQGSKGGRIGHATAFRYGRAIAKAAGLPANFRPNHGLRHSFASHLASSGEVDMYVLQRLLTHKSPMMTQRYAHLRDEVLRRGADVMGRIMGEAEANGKA